MTQFGDIQKEIHFFCDIFRLAVEVSTYLRYTRNLDFFQPPDYNYMRQLWWDIFQREGFVDDGLYDWTKVSVLRYIYVCVDVCSYIGLK